MNSTMVRSGAPPQPPAEVWFFNAWLGFLIVRRALPGRELVAVGAGALLLLSPTEPSRFFVFSTGMSYASSLCVLLFSFWMLQVAVDKRSFGWLLAACLASSAAHAPAARCRASGCGPATCSAATPRAGSTWRAARTTC